MLHKGARIISISVLFLSVFFHPAIADEEILTWQGCLKEAAQNHPDLIAAEEEVRQSEASKKITASTLYPQINSSLTAATAKTASEKSGGSTSDTYAYGLTGSQLLFDGTKTISDVRSAAEDVIASRQNFRFTSTTIRLKLRTAFVDLLKAQEMLRITQEIYDIRRSNLELVSLRYESGLEHKGALLTADADLAQAQYEISQAQRDVEVAQRELAKEMGRQHLTPMQVKGDFQVKLVEKDKPDFSILATGNPSLQQLIAQKNSAKFGIRSAYANFSPKLSGQAGINKSGSHWSPSGDQWNLGLTLSMPIFEGGLRVAQVSKAEALFNQLRENERSTRDEIILTLEQTWASLQDAIENVGVQKKQLAAAEERSEIAQAQYSTGFITFDNWIIIEDNLVQAKRTFLDTQANALFAEANWIQAKGETLEYE